MESLLATCQRSSDPELHYAEFARILKERDTHPNADYYVMRQIILNNLYGVDIEEEAVEICKLRLFLLLAAQIERRERSSRCRTSTSISGRATRWSAMRPPTKSGRRLPAGQLTFDFNGDAKRSRIRPEFAGRAFEHFKRVQMDDAAALDDLRDAKLAYRDKINELRSELDRYLYKQQGAKDALASWKARTQPFHWFAEFHHVVIGLGGFGVIIGNPPYVRNSK